MYRVIYVFFLLTLIACNQQSDQESDGSKNKPDAVFLKAELDQLESELQGDQSNKVNLEKASLLVNKSIEYVDFFPQDSLSVAYLFRAADVSVGIKKFEEAIEYWERLQKEYSNHEKAPLALFFQGFTCDNHLNNKLRAKEYYEKFLRKHPDHKYADQVKTLLSQLDKTPEELIKEFQKKRKEEQ